MQRAYADALACVVNDCTRSASALYHIMCTESCALYIQFFSYCAYLKGTAVLQLTHIVTAMRAPLLLGAHLQ
jgi:hypothetical protein